MPLLLDVQNLLLVEESESTVPGRVVECDLLIAGAGLGGCAAALTACRAGRRVVLTEETDWLGGQFTSQGVSAPDEHRFIESSGGTRTYYELRDGIRRAYRDSGVLNPADAAEPALNPGGGWVSRLCCEAPLAERVLRELLAPFAEDGHLTVLIRHRAARAQVQDDRVRSVDFRHLDSEALVQIRADFVLDATELGDLLPLTGAEYVVGAESRSDTGEPNAQEAAADWCVQSFTYPFVLRRAAHPTPPIPEPPNYALNRSRQPYTLQHRYYDERGWVTYRMDTTAPGAAGPFWTYRRIADRARFADPKACDRAMINWPGNDYRHGALIDVPPGDALQSLREARDLALGFCRWLQTECPRDDGGFGYPEFELDPSALGSSNGLSKYPYIRESRRIRSLGRVLEQDLAHPPKSGATGPARATLFRGSVGVGWYGIDIHPCEGEERLPPFASRPFQIPLKSLVPIRLKNLLPACKNIGVTHITNGAYRLHPVEWNIGESAAALALFCLDRGLTPAAVANDDRRTRRFQRRLVRLGVPLYWTVDVPHTDPHFEAIQLLCTWGVFPVDDAHLEFRPDSPPDSQLLSQLTAGPAWARGGVERTLLNLLPRLTGISRRTLAASLLEVLNT